MNRKAQRAPAARPPARNVLQPDIADQLMMDQRMSRLGVELLTKAALCAILVGLAAGVFAALLGA